MEQKTKHKNTGRRRRDKEHRWSQWTKFFNKMKLRDFQFSSCEVIFFSQNSYVAIVRDVQII